MTWTATLRRSHRRFVRAVDAERTKLRQFWDSMKVARALKARLGREKR